MITNCNLAEDNTELKQITNLIKKRLNIYSLQCDFTSILDVNEKYKHPGVFPRIKVGQFAIRGDDLFLMAPETYTITHTRRKKKDSTSSNLLELLINRKEYEEVENKVEGFEGFYRHKGICTSRSIAPKVSFQDDEFKIIENEINISKFTVPLIPITGEPRILIGFIGMNALNIYENRPKRRLVECLEKEGKFYLYQKENYKILWHECFYEDSSQPTGQEKLSFEVWIDENENIVKIIEGEFPTRSFGIEFVKKILDKYNIQIDVTCDYPCYIARKFEFSEFREFPDGVRVPTKGVITTYEPEIDEKHLGKFIEARNKYERNEISPDEIIVLYAAWVNPVEEIKKEVEVQIHPETLIVNQPIPDSVFIAPTPTNNEDNINEKGNTQIKPRYTRYKIGFLICCVAVIIVGLFITKRYFGWNV